MILRFTAGKKNPLYLNIDTDKEVWNDKDERRPYRVYMQVPLATYTELMKNLDFYCYSWTDLLNPDPAPLNPEDPEVATFMEEHDDIPLF